jgi:hypothetical protein
VHYDGYKNTEDITLAEAILASSNSWKWKKPDLKTISKNYNNVAEIPLQNNF